MGFTYVPTQAKLAELLGVSGAYITQIKKQGAPVEKKPLGIPVEPVRQWLTAHSAARVEMMRERKAGAAAEGATVDLKEKVLKATARDREAAAELKELRIQIEKGELIPLEEIKRRDVERISAVKSGLLALPRRLAQEVHGLDIRAIEDKLRVAFREQLTRFSEM